MLNVYGIEKVSLNEEHVQFKELVQNEMPRDVEAFKNNEFDYLYIPTPTDLPYTIAITPQEISQDYPEVKFAVSEIIKEYGGQRFLDRFMNRDKDLLHLVNTEKSYNIFDFMLKFMDAYIIHYDKNAPEAEIA